MQKKCSDWRQQLKTSATTTKGTQILFSLVLSPLHGKHNTQPNVLRNIIKLFTITDKNVSYSAKGASLLLMHLPLQISTQYPRRTWPLGDAFKRFVHSLQSQEHWREVVMRNTHENTLNRSTNKQSKKKLFSVERLRWTNVYATLTEAIVIRNCAQGAKDVLYVWNQDTPIRHWGLLFEVSVKTKGMIGGEGGELESYDSDSRMTLS